MIIDDLIGENALLWDLNDLLLQELHEYRYCLWSVLNILDPDQREIIRNDLIHIENQLSDYAQP